MRKSLCALVMMLCALCYPSKSYAYDIYILDNCSTVGSYTSDKGTKGTTHLSLNYITYSNISEGTTVTLTATPEEGYTFDGWLDDYGNYYIYQDDDPYVVTPSSTTSNTVTFNMPGCDVWIYECYFSTAEICTSHDVVYDHDGTGTDPTGDVSGCEDATISFTPSPGTGHKYNGATVYASDMETPLTTLDANTTSFSMYNQDVYVVVYYTAQSYTVSLDREGGTTGAESITVTYNSSTITGFSAPSKEGYTFGGYYTADNGTGTRVLSATGVLQAGVTGYTGAGGIWTKTSTPTTLYAKWTINKHKLTVGTPDDIAIKATTGGKDIIEGKDSTTVNYGSSVTLSYSTVTGGMAFNSWLVTKDADDSDVTASVVDGNTLTMPDYDVTITAKMYAKAKLQTRCLAEPEFMVEGNVHLTSYANVEVFTTSTTDNNITITCSNFKSANRLYILYLNSAGDTIVKESSPFRLCNTDYSKADASNDYIDISAVNWSEGETFCVAYKPASMEYNQTDTFKIRLTPRYGASTNLGYQDITVYGRALPQEFVVASKFGGQWYALPNTLANTAVSARAASGIRITVDNETTPTAAVYAPTTAVYRGESRYSDKANRYGIRLTDGTNHLQVSSTGSNNYMWLSSTGSSSCQDWCLTSSNFGAYAVTIPSNTGNESKQIGMNGGNIGYYNSPTSPSGDIYILPITNKYTELAASVHEWGQHGVIVAADMTNVASATMNVGSASPVAADLSAIDAASLTAGKFVRVYNAETTVGAFANEGKLIYIHWKNSGGDELGVSPIEIPCVIAADGVMKTLDGDKSKWAKKEVHILPGATLTADGGSFGGKKVTVPTMYVYPGATLKVSTDTLNVTNLRLRYGWTRAGEKTYDVARVFIVDNAALTKTNASVDYDIYDSSEGNHYYPLAVPFETAVSSIDYLDETLAGASTYGTHYVVKEYNGANRAEAGAVDANWVAVGSDKTLKPGVGYIMTGVGIPAYGGCIIRIPLSYNDAWTSDGEKGTANYADADHRKDTIHVLHHTGTASENDKRHEGWNMLGVPYMSCFASKDYATHSEDVKGDAFITGHMTLSGDPANPYGWSEDGVAYVSVPTHDFSEYLQYNIADGDTKLLPGWSFFVQIAKDGRLTFENAGLTDNSSLPIYAPARTTDSTLTKIKTGVILSSESGEASDKFGLIISDRYTSDYEVGADLEKLFGNGYTLATYSLSLGTRLAFNALSTADAAQVIPVGYRAPADGQYTFALNPRYPTDGLLRLELIDYQTGDLTDLLTSSYTFTTARTQDDTRFAIHAVYTDPAPATPTGAAPPLLNPDEPLTRKFILNGQLYIQRGQTIYDASGKEVRL